MACLQNSLVPSFCECRGKALLVKAHNLLPHFYWPLVLSRILDRHILRMHGKIAGMF